MDKTSHKTTRVLYERPNLHCRNSNENNYLAQCNIMLEKPFWNQKIESGHKKRWIFSSSFLLTFYTLDHCLK